MPEPLFCLLVHALHDVGILLHQMIPSNHLTEKNNISRLLPPIINCLLTRLDSSAIIFPATY
jgi:hypothetical protein